MDQFSSLPAPFRDSIEFAPPAFKSPSLVVQEVPFFEYEDILKVIDDWMKIISILDKNDITKDSKEIISFTKIAICTILDRGQSNINNSLFVCTDSKKNILGLGFFSKDMCVIRTLATHPNNLVYPGSDRVNRVNGVGTAMIRYFGEIALRNQMPIKVTSTDSAKIFYEILGFVHVPPGDTKNLSLTVKKIQELIKVSADSKVKCTRN